MDLYAKIIALFGTFRNDLGRKAAKSDIAPEFNSGNLYKVGDLVIKDGALHSCTQAGYGNNAVFSLTSVGKAIDNVKSEIPDTHIQSDWAESDNTKPDFIKNKPSIPDAQVQSNWAESDNTKPDFIKNKPASMAPTSHSSTHASNGNDAIHPESIGAVPAYEFVDVDVATQSGHQICTLSPFKNNQLDTSNRNDIADLIIDHVEDSTISGAMRDLWFVVKTGSVAIESIDWPENTIAANGDSLPSSIAASTTAIFLMSEYTPNRFILAQQLS